LGAHVPAQEPFGLEREVGAIDVAARAPDGEREVAVVVALDAVFAAALGVAGRADEDLLAREAHARAERPTDEPGVDAALNALDIGAVPAALQALDRALIAAERAERGAREQPIAHEGRVASRAPYGQTRDALA